MKKRKMVVKIKMLNNFQFNFLQMENWVWVVETDFSLSMRKHYMKRCHNKDLNKVYRRCNKLISETISRSISAAAPPLVQPCSLSDAAVINSAPTSDYMPPTLLRARESCFDWLRDYEGSRDSAALGKVCRRECVFMRHSVFMCVCGD